jgi:hypothetical protein
MFVRKRNSEERFQRPAPEPLQQRKQRQLVEGSQAMEDYRRTQEAARDRMAELRAERQRREQLEKNA